MKSSGKMCLMIILKVTKNQGFTLSLEDTFLEKEGEEVNLIPHPSPPPTPAASLGLKSKFLSIAIPNNSS